MWVGRYACSLRWGGFVTKVPDHYLSVFTATNDFGLGVWVKFGRGDWWLAMAIKLCSILEGRIPEKNETNVILDAALIVLAIWCEEELAYLRWPVEICYYSIIGEVGIREGEKFGDHLGFGSKVKDGVTSVCLGGFRWSKFTWLGLLRDLAPFLRILRSDSRNHWMSEIELYDLIPPLGALEPSMAVHSPCFFCLFVCFPLERADPLQTPRFPMCQRLILWFKGRIAPQPHTSPPLQCASTHFFQFCSPGWPSLPYFD